MSEDIDKLVGRLRRGIGKTEEILGRLDSAQWEMVLYEEPYPWTIRDLLAHFVSTEEGLLRLGRDITESGPGAPDDFDYDDFNAAEQERLAGVPPKQLLSALRAARQETIAWVQQLDEQDLDRVGRHPGLGKITLETFINAIYGHQLMHMRDLTRRLS